MSGRTDGNPDGRKSGQKKISSLTFISMTHITIKTIRHLVSETQTDRQRQFISRWSVLLKMDIRKVGRIENFTVR